MRTILLEISDDTGRVNHFTIKPFYIYTNENIICVIDAVD